MGRFEHAATMRHADGATFEADWFFADDNAKCMDIPTAFGSSRFDEDRFDLGLLGEIRNMRPPKVRGKRNTRLVGDHYCGARRLWQNGWPAGYGTGDVAKCCPLQTTVKTPAGGLLLGGAAQVVHPVYESGTGGILAGGVSSHRIARLSVYVSGGILVGGWTPNSGGILVGGYSTHKVVVPVMAVTSVGLKLPTEFVVSGSPVIDVGVLEGEWELQLPNTFLAGPVAGDADVPEFRTIQTADVASCQIPVSNLTGPGTIPPGLVPIGAGGNILTYEFNGTMDRINLGAGWGIEIATIPAGAFPVRVWAQTTEGWPSGTSVTIDAVNLTLGDHIQGYGAVPAVAGDALVETYNRAGDSEPIVESEGGATLIASIGLPSSTAGRTTIWVEWFDANAELGGGGGGGGGTPGDTVVAETTWAKTPAAGSAIEYSRADHTHGTPAMPTAGDVGADPAGSAAAAQAAANAYTDGKGANTVALETTYGKVAAPGTSALYSRGDHTHGTPAMPTASQVGADPAGSAATAQSNAKAYTDSQIAALPGAGQPADATLTALAGLAMPANSLIVSPGGDNFTALAFAANTFPATASTGPMSARPITNYGLGLVNVADASAAQTYLGIAPPPAIYQRGRINGLGPWSGGALQINVPRGQFRDDADTTTWSMAQLTKYLDPTNAFVMGPNQPCMDRPGVVANTWYHVFAIWHPTMLVGDVLTSLDPTSPLMPSGWTVWRRIGAVLADPSKQVTPLVSRPGGWFYWSNGLASDGSVTLASGVSQLITLNVPKGIMVEAVVNIVASAAATLYFTSPDCKDENASFSGPYRASLFIATANGSGQVRVWTNANQQIRVVTNVGAGCNLHWSTMGWMDPRGIDQ